MLFLAIVMYGQVLLGAAIMDVGIIFSRGKVIMDFFQGLPKDFFQCGDGGEISIHFFTKTSMGKRYISQFSAEALPRMGMETLHNAMPEKSNCKNVCRQQPHDQPPTREDNRIFPKAV